MVNATLTKNKKTSKEEKTRRQKGACSHLTAEGDGFLMSFVPEKRCEGGRWSKALRAACRRLARDSKKANRHAESNGQSWNDLPDWGGRLDVDKLAP